MQNYESVNVVQRERINCQTMASFQPAGSWCLPASLGVNTKFALEGDMGLNHFKSKQRICIIRITAANKTQ